jgi:hypothetical protein
VIALECRCAHGKDRRATMLDLKKRNTEDTKNHSAAEPQPHSTSAAETDRKNLRFGRAEARPSE